MNAPGASRSTPLPALLQWTLPGRALVFALAAASIWCLLSEIVFGLGLGAYFAWHARRWLPARPPALGVA